MGQAETRAKEAEVKVKQIEEAADAAIDDAKKASVTQKAKVYLLWCPKGLEVVPHGVSAGRSKDERNRCQVGGKAKGDQG